MTIQEKMAKEKTGKLMLSIVMISIPERKKVFRTLYSKVKRQIDYCHKIHPALGDVEVVTVITPRFPQGPSIGEKRQLGLERSGGRYVCWLDDDDDVSPDYVETLLRLAYEDPDILTFNNLSRFDGFWCVVKMSLGTKEDEQVRPGIVNRRPYHVCGWKRDIAIKAGFEALNKDEDTGFVSRVLPLCSKEQHTESIIHEYKRITKSYALEALRS